MNDYSQISNTFLWNIKYHTSTGRCIVGIIFWIDNCIIIVDGINNTTYTNHSFDNGPKFVIFQIVKMYFSSTWHPINSTNTTYALIVNILKCTFFVGIIMTNRTTIFLNFISLTNLEYLFRNISTTITYYKW